MDAEKRKYGIGLVVVVALFLFGCILTKFVTPGTPGREGGTAMSSTTPSDTTTPGETGDGEPGAEYGVEVTLSEGQAQVSTPVPLPTGAEEPLTLAEIDAVFSRLPVLPASEADQAEFKYPVELLPPPRPGTTIKDSFPPDELAPTPGAVAAGPLEVLRYAPEGEISIAPFVSVTFNQPMVALGTLEDLASQTVPVRVNPEMPGTWRWIGTKTLTFEYDSDLIDRLPKATEYTLTIPAGTKSITGGTLAQAVEWKFTTPAPIAVTIYPRDIPQPLQPLIFIAFDQRIEPQAVLETVQLYAGSTSYDLTLASDAEIQKDKQVSQLVKNALDGRWLVFKAAKPFPAETSVSVTIGPGTPSAEGPLVTTAAQSFGFSTYAPLKVMDHGCSWGDTPCPPQTPFYIRFNNSIDDKAYTEDMVTVKPAIPGMLVNLYGDTLNISGQTSGQTTYTVTLSRNLKDIFGQTLGKDQKLTFKVGKAEPALSNPNQVFITLDPAAKKPVFSVYAINYNKLDVKIYAVQPTDWDAFKKYLSGWRQTDQVPPMPGERVFDKTISLNIPDDILSEVDIDLVPYLKNGFGHFVVVVEPPKGMFESENAKWRRFSQTIHTWVQVTQIGVDAYTDYTDMVVWATNLKDGAPLTGVTIQPNNAGSKFATAEDGTIRFRIPSGATALIASKGNDTAILPHSPYAWGQDYGWVPSSPLDALRWYVLDDRQMYRPGEEVHIKGWMRRIGARKDGDVSLVGSQVSSVNFQLTDPQGNMIGVGQVDVNTLGGFDLTLTIPQTVNLGYAYLNLTAAGTLSGLTGETYTHTFQIQEFRRPEFEVTARNESTGPYFAGGEALLAVEAKYYAGGALPNADVTWEVSSTPGKYSPPNWSDFVFGDWTPWWWSVDDLWSGEDESTSMTYTGKTDESGTHYLKLDLKQAGRADKNPQPVSVSAQATVMDVNRQAWSSTTTLLVHPADLYIGLRSERYFVQRGTPLKIFYIVTDLDGNPVAERDVVITAARLEWKYRNGVWTEEEADTQKCTAISGLEPAACTFETPIGGSYRITAQVMDNLERVNQTRFTRWVSGGQRPPSRKVEHEEVTLVPDMETYQPGDTAQILVQSPFSPAEGLLTVSRSGFLYTTRFEIEDGSTTLSIPIEKEHIPNLQIQVDLVGSAPRVNDKGEVIAGTEPRPAFASGSLNLSIPPIQRTLSLDVKPQADRIEPGGETTLNVLLKDANGKPVPDAELAVIVVDEAILALTDYRLSDPISIFYSTRESGVSSIYGRNSIILANPEVLTDAANENARQALPTGAVEAPMMMMEADMAFAAAPAPGEAKGAQGQQTAISVRSDFNPLAVFAPEVRTGTDGTARVEVKVPDNLTRYRVMVVAVDDSGAQFGTGEANITARLPLMVRPSAPRFLNFGDKFELPVVLQNQTNEPMTVDVVARASNLELEKAGLRVTIPANDRIEVRFPASTLMAGTARVQVAAVSGNAADAAVVELPVYTPATTEAFATYGVVDEGAVAQPVMYPTGVFPQYGGLEINTSSTALQALTDAVLYLVNYPFECSEQISSRILAVASLRDVLTAFEADGLPAPGEMEAAVERDIERLQGMQNYDGGFPYWRRGFESVPFNTIHVAHALYRAGQKDFAVPEEMRVGALNYLREIESHYPYWYSEQTRRTLSSYALYVRNLFGDRDAQKAQQLLRDAGIDKLSMEAIGWLWPVIDNESQLDEIRRFVNNHVVETAGAANFTTAYDEQTYLLLSSDRRTDAILLDALMEDNPQSDLVVKVVNGLLAHRTKGRWGNTQENVFVLVALDRYFKTYESKTPDFVARLWLGDTYAGSHEFVGRTTERAETLIPMRYVLEETAAGGGTQDLILSKEGTGRLYYRLGLRYAPTDLNLDPLDAGFVVQRVYEAVDDPADVTRDSDGVWHIKAGARVRVHLTMVADNRRYHVALVDPLPAGLEIVNPALSVSQTSTQEDPGTLVYGWWWWRTWYEHQNMRDDRAEAFTSLLWDGVYQYTYLARATTPGTFIVPPAKAEEMYSPEVFGRSGSDWVVVE